MHFPEGRIKYRHKLNIDRKRGSLSEWLSSFTLMNTRFDYFFKNVNTFWMSIWLEYGPYVFKMPNEYKVNILYRYQICKYKVLKSSWIWSLKFLSFFKISRVFDSKRLPDTHARDKNKITMLRFMLTLPFPSQHIRILLSSLL